jgi:hypothetical protein
MAGASGRCRGAAGDTSATEEADAVAEANSGLWSNVTRQTDPARLWLGNPAAAMARWRWLNVRFMRGHSRNDEFFGSAHEGFFRCAR